MNKYLLMRISGVIFAGVMLSQLIRAVLRWEMSFAGVEVPIWVSVCIAVIGLYCSYECFRRRAAHYICTGGCGGVSSKPGVCQAEGCKKKKMPLEECQV